MYYGHVCREKSRGRSELLLTSQHVCGTGTASRFFFSSSELLTWERSERILKVAASDDSDTSSLRPHTLVATQLRLGARRRTLTKTRKYDCVFFPLAFFCFLSRVAYLNKKWKYIKKLKLATKAQVEELVRTYEHQVSRVSLEALIEP